MPITNPTLRLLDMLMLAAMSDCELCDPDLESRFLPGLISCAASLPVAFSSPSLTIPDVYYSTLGHVLIYIGIDSLRQFTASNTPLASIQPPLISISSHHIPLSPLNHIMPAL